MIRRIKPGLKCGLVLCLGCDCGKYCGQSKRDPNTIVWSCNYIWRAVRNHQGVFSNWEWQYVFLKGRSAWWVENVSEGSQCGHATWSRRFFARWEIISGCQWPCCRTVHELRCSEKLYTRTCSWIECGKWGKLSRMVPRFLTLTTNGWQCWCIYWYEENWGGWEQVRIFRDLLH